MLLGHIPIGTPTTDGRVIERLRLEKPPWMLLAANPSWGFPRVIGMIPGVVAHPGGWGLALELFPELVDPDRLLGWFLAPDLDGLDVSVDTVDPDDVWCSMKGRLLACHVSPDSAWPPGVQRPVVSV